MGTTFTVDASTANTLVTHAYNAPGTFRVGVKYMDNDGQWSQPYPFTITIREVRRVFYVKDHLGNIRQSLNESGTVVAAQDYYPYGEFISGRSYNSGHPLEKYRFTEKERDIGTGYDYFGGRLYDPALPMWLQVDPKARKYPSLSPYAYCANNPLKLYDPNGKEFKISGDKFSAYQNVLKLVGKANASKVILTAGGQIQLTAGYTVTKGGGSELISNLVNSSKQYEYSAGTEATIMTKKGPKTIGTGHSGIVSAIKDGMQNPNTLTAQPMSGDAHITMDPNKSYYTKDGKSVEYQNIVYHELSEAYIMTEEGLVRYDNEGKESAHTQAGTNGVNRANVDGVDSNGSDGGTEENPIFIR